MGLALQAISTALFLASSQARVLLVARALQGASAAVVYSVGLAILVDTVGVDQIGRQAGYFLSSANFGVIISPMLGGYVYAHAGYEEVVYMMIGLVAVDILLRFIMIEKTKALKWRTNLSVVDVEQSTQQQTDYGTFGRTAEQENDPLASDNRSTHDLIPQVSQTDIRTPVFLQLLISPRALSSFLAVFVGYSVLAAFDAGLAVFVKQHFHWTPNAAGLIFLALALPSLLSPIAGSCSDRFGPRWIVVGGFLAAASGLFAIGFISEPELWQVGGLCALLVVIGL